jgi:hypothetical protein
MQIIGTVYRIFETQQINATFRKREFVVEYSENPNYPQYIKFEAIQEKCDDLNNIKIGDRVEVSFNLKGRKWINPQNQEIFFNTLDAWRIVKLDSSMTSTPVTNVSTNYQTPSVENNPVQEENDDLPF